MSAGPVLVCFAVNHERRFFRPAPAWNCRVVVTGIGRHDARRGLERALEPERPALVLTCGYAGGLNPALKLGEVLFEVEGADADGKWQMKNGTGATSFRDPIGRLEILSDSPLSPALSPRVAGGEGGDNTGYVRFEGRADGKRRIAEGRGLSAALLALGAVRGRFHEADRVVVTAGEKHALWQATGADAVEMESAEIRRLCKERAIPAATIRVISDTAAEDLPLDFNQVSGPDQNLSYAKLAVQLVRAPALIGRLLQLQRHLNVAAQRLAEVLEGTLAGLHQARSQLTD